MTTREIKEDLAISAASAYRTLAPGWAFEAHPRAMQQRNQEIRFEGKVDRSAVGLPTP
jgi:hypothetical protein